MYQTNSSSSSPSPSSFSMIFSKPYDHHNQHSYDHDYVHHHDYDYDHYNNNNSNDDANVYSFSNNYGGGVDCTLSLGTPSTRLDDNDTKRNRNDKVVVSNFSCWDVFQPRTTSHKNPGRTNSHNSNNNNNDPLLARRCANCDTTSTPLWRNGPRGPKSLCNACGIRFKKEERRASAAASAPSPAIDQPSHVYSQHQQHHHNQYNQYHLQNSNNNWNNYSHNQAHQPQKSIPNCLSPANEFRFIDNDVVDSSDTGISFLSWRLNVTDRPSLVHDFTR